MIHHQSQEQPQYLNGMELHQLEQLIQTLGEKKYRARQLYEGFYRHRYNSFSQFSNLPKTLLASLQGCQIGRLQLITHLKSQIDTTQKFSFAISPTQQIEAVWIPSSDNTRKTICISCQSGCTLNCAFCATGKLPFAGNLKTWQILAQVIQVEEQVAEKATNIVFMGMGEPMHNYFAVLRAARLLHDKDTFGFAARKITISTAGDVKGIKRFIKNQEPFNLAISLNHPDAQLRSQLMDINQKYPLSELLAAAKKFTQELKRRITFEYVMIPEVNMAEKQAEKLVRIANSLNCKINLIPLNTAYNGWRAPTETEIMMFRERIQKARVPILNRRSPGKDIHGACGMLSLLGAKI